MTSPTKTVQVAVVQAGAIPFDTEARVDKVVRLGGDRRRRRAGIDPARRDRLG